MTHANHRQGTVESLRGDWVILMRFERGINDQGGGPKVKKFLELSLKHDPVNAGCAKIGTAVDVGLQKLIDEVGKSEDRKSVV